MPGSKSTLYWTHLEIFTKCPQQYLWRYGWEDLEIGGGPGRPKPKPERRSEHHMLMGIVIQAVVEDMYNHELWRVKPKEELFKRLTELTKQKFAYRRTKNFIDFKESPSLEELFKICLDGVINYPKTMAKHRLLGDYAKSEVDLTGWLDQYNKVGGKADIIVRREDTGITIMDGKNSAHKGKYLNPDQLRWYALCFQRAFSEYPDRLGYIYWRFPYDKETGEEGVEWVKYTKDDLKRLAQQAIETKTKMFKQKFNPTPLVATCRFCDYAKVCSDAARSKPRVDNFLENLGLDTESGVVEFGIAKKKV